LSKWRYYHQQITSYPKAVFWNNPLLAPKGGIQNMAITRTCGFIIEGVFADDIAANAVVLESKTAPSPRRRA